MDKVGIITFHTAINYGGHLQAYALQTAISQMGMSAEIIDYTKKVEHKSVGHYIEAILGIFKIIKIKKYRKSSEYLLRKEKFQNFDKHYFFLSQKCENRNDVLRLSKDYLAIVCGSDQIWNPFHTHCNDIFYGGTIEQNRRIAYAPSFGTDSIPKRIQVDYKRLLNAVNYLSVRELSGARIIEELTGRKSLVVVDPTLLISKDVWLSLVHNSKNDYMEYSNKPFVVCYFLGKHERDLKTINDYFYEKGILVLNISQTPNGKYNNTIDVFPGVEEFLFLICNSLAVFTDSYHGTMFSIIFERDFYSITRNDTKVNLNSRIGSFLSKIHCSEHMVKNVSYNLLNNMSVDYHTINETLTEWKKESYSFLRESIFDIEGRTK